MESLSAKGLKDVFTVSVSTVPAITWIYSLWRIMTEQSIRANSGWMRKEAALMWIVQSKIFQLKNERKRGETVFYSGFWCVVRAWNRTQSPQMKTPQKIAESSVVGQFGF